MSFGSDTPGGPVEGIGGNESGIGGFGGGDGGYESRIAQALSQLSVAEQERLFRDVIDPLMSSAYGPAGRAGEKVMGVILNVAMNAMFPGLGLLSAVTGTTGEMTDWLTDNAVRQELQSILGISGKNFNTSLDVLDAARSSGATETQIANAYNTVSSKRGGVMGLWEDITGTSAAKASTGAAGTAASYQQQALNYLKQMGAIPLAAQKRLAGAYGVQGGVGPQIGLAGQAQLLQQARTSPLYQQIMGTQEAGEDAIMRHAGATGGLRSGNIQDALARYSGELERGALTQSYDAARQQDLQNYAAKMGGLTSLAGMGSYAPQIAQTIGGIGSTLAAGQTAAAQAQQQGSANLLGLGGEIFKGLGGISGVAGGIGDLWRAGSSSGVSGIISEIGNWF